MFLLSIKKMLKNKWITACLFFGCFLIVAILSSIPAYSAGILNKLLIKDLQEIQVRNNKYPGVYSIKTKFQDSVDDANAKYNLYTQTIKQNKTNFSASVFQSLDDVRIFERTANGPFYSFREGSDTSKYSKALSSDLFINGTKSLLDYVNIISGEPFKAGKNGNYYEAIVSEKVAYQRQLSVGSTYILMLNNKFIEKSTPVKVKITGIYSPKDTSDVFWYQMDEQEQSIVIDYDTVCNDLIENNHYFLDNATSTLTYNYEQLTNSQISPLYSEFMDQSNEFHTYTSRYNPILLSLEQYFERVHQLNTIVIALIMPLLIILLLYIYMIAKLIVGYDENEITVLKSRGATQKQILQLYLFECTLISIVALLTGIPFGMALSRMIGYSNGFLEFVGRSSLHIEYSLKMLLFPLSGILIFFIVTFIPIILASRKNILNHKQTQGLELKTPIWQKACFDFILVAISLYGLYLFYDKQEVILTSASVLKTGNNPLIFIMSSLFILGVSLFALRIYPWMLKIIHLIGKRYWPASFHVLMINMSRNKSMGKLIILFLTFTVSVGIFNAVTARTITQNSKDQIYYENGADLILEEEWKPSGYIQLQPPPSPATPVYGQAQPFEPFQSLDGVDAAARVYSNSTVEFFTSSGSVSTNFMAVVPDEFSKVAWFRDDLLDYHINDYLNLLAKYPNTCLISKTMSKKSNIAIGDNISVNFLKSGDCKSDLIELQVAGIIDYFPTYNKYKKVKLEDNNLLVANFSFIFNKTPMDKYKVWLKMTPDATIDQVYQSIEEKKIKLLSVNNVRETVISDVNNDPFVQGINGTLSLTFIISLITTCVGFLIYWIVSVKNRALQFSVLRSMGISKKSLYGMIAFEQLLISGFAVGIGTIIGGVTSRLFVYSVGLYLNLSSQIPPFKILVEWKDYLNIYGVVLVLIIICISVIISIVRRLNITATLKLGED